MREACKNMSDEKNGKKNEPNRNEEEKEQVGKIAIEEALVRKRKSQGYCIGVDVEVDNESMYSSRKKIHTI